LRLTGRPARRSGLRLPRRAPRRPRRRLTRRPRALVDLDLDLAPLARLGVDLIGELAAARLHALVRLIVEVLDLAGQRPVPGDHALALREAADILRPVVAAEDVALARRAGRPHRGLGDVRQRDHRRQRGGEGGARVASEASGAGHPPQSAQPPAAAQDPSARRRAVGLARRAGPGA
jgi:hypothetical protein